MNLQTGGVSASTIFAVPTYQMGFSLTSGWIDLVPAFFSGVAIMRSSRHNVATWNLTNCELSVSESGQYLVDNEPLGFYHFTGFDSGAHRIMAAKNAGNNQAVHQLVNW